jgi:hypothetical protein
MCMSVSVCVEVAEGFEEEVKGVVAALLECNVLELVAQRLLALNEKVVQHTRPVRL